MMHHLNLDDMIPQTKHSIYLAHQCGSCEFLSWFIADAKTVASVSCTYSLLVMCS
jgi:hypothetical protein